MMLALIPHWMPLSTAPKRCIIGQETDEWEELTGDCVSVGTSCFLFFLIKVDKLRTKLKQQIRQTNHLRMKLGKVIGNLTKKLCNFCLSIYYNLP